MDVKTCIDKCILKALRPQIALRTPSFAQRCFPTWIKMQDKILPGRITSSTETETCCMSAFKGKCLLMWSSKGSYLSRKLALRRVAFLSIPTHA